MFTESQTRDAAQRRSARHNACRRRLDPAWAWAPYRPDAQRPWNLRWAGHLFRRAGFRRHLGQLQQAVADGPQRTIDACCTPKATWPPSTRAYDEHEAAGDRTASRALRGWWLRRMLLTPHPLLEKMTLFWHGHFAVDVAKVGEPPR